MATQPDPWAEFRAPQPTGPRPTQGGSGVPELVVGRTPTPQTPTQEALDRARLREMEGGSVPQGYRRRSDGNLEFIPGGPADPATPRNRSTRQLPQTAIDRLGEGTTGLMNLERAASSFRDEFAGNALTGGLENTIQSRFSSFGSPGQQQWWADIQASDNVLRHALFGASLTAGEQAAWERTTVTPSMDPAQVRANLSRRAELARDILRRQARTYRANGYNEEAIRESLGELESIIDGEPDAPEGSGAQGDQPATAPPGTSVMFNDEARPPTPEGFSPEQASAYDAFLRANPRATADQLRAFGQSIGFEINNAEEIIQARDRGAGFQPGGTARVREPVVNRADATGAPIVTSLELATGINPDVAMRGAADVLSLGLADEIAAAGDTIFGGGTYAENLYNQRGIDRYDTQNSPGTRLAGQVAGGALIPTGVGRSAFGAARSSLRAGAGREAARAAAREAGARRLGLEGAAFGGAYGFGSGEGSFTDRLSQGGVSALIGGGAGYALGRGVGAIVDRYGRGGESPRYRNALEAYEARAAAERQGIDLMPADVGGPMTRRLTAGASQSPVSAGTIIRGAQRTREQGAERLGELAREAGAPQRQEVLGDTAIRAANDYVESSGTAGREMYREARELSQDVMANAPRAFRNLNAQLRELGATREVEGPLIDGLNRFRSVIADESGLKPLDIDAIRRLRTAVATEARTEGLRGTDYQRRAGQVLDDLREDITSQLSPEAARAFRRADDAWRERLTTIDGVLNNVLGRDRSAEGVARGLSNMAVGDSARLGSFLNAIPVDDARIIRGSLIQDLGRATPWQQNAVGDVFSFDTFLTNWNRLPERTRATLFPGGARRDIEDLARVAEAVKETGKYANRSNTGSTVIGGALGAGSVMQPMIIPAIALNYVSGRILASQPLVRLLSRTPANPAQARAQIQQLGKIARTQPAISSEVLGLQQALMRQFEGAARSPATRAAADEDQDIRRE